MRNPFKVIFDYLRPSFEGDDGKFSYKRVSQFVFTAVMVVMPIRPGIHDKYSWYVFLTFAVLFALVAAIISVPQIISLAKAGLLFKGVDATAVNNISNDSETKDGAVSSTDNGALVGN
jgi:hypothetical protein